MSKTNKYQLKEHYVTVSQCCGIVYKYYNCKLQIFMESMPPDPLSDIL